MRLWVDHCNPWRASTVGVRTRRWRRREELRSWRRWRKVGALRRRRREVTAGLLGLADFGLERRRQVGQVELAWFRGSWGAVCGVLRR